MHPYILLKVARMRYLFFCDFDGTITKEDVVDKILERFADPKWIEVEQSWVQGRIGSRDCLSMQMSLVKAEKRELIDSARGFEIDKGFIDFYRFCKSRAIKIIVLSDGIRAFIQSILKRWGLDDIPVYSNALKSNKTPLEMLFPYFSKDCTSGSGICKCDLMERLSGRGDMRILVGDGRSDFCPAGKADLTFAKSELLDFCKAEEVRHISYREFGDVLEWLEDQLGLCYFSKEVSNVKR
jgi:2,3-diketo-5-methylthio-1-phosphopentane phosphatase